MAKFKGLCMRFQASRTRVLTGLDVTLAVMLFRLGAPNTIRHTIRCLMFSASLENENKTLKAVYDQTITRYWNSDQQRMPRIGVILQRPFGWTLGLNELTFVRLRVTLTSMRIYVQPTPDTYLGQDVSMIDRVRMAAISINIHPRCEITVTHLPTFLMAMFCANEISPFNGRRMLMPLTSVTLSIYSSQTLTQLRSMTVSDDLRLQTKASFPVKIGLLLLEGRFQRFQPLPPIEFFPLHPPDIPIILLQGLPMIAGRQAPRSPRQFFLVETVTVFQFQYTLTLYSDRTAMVS
ncbi:hypothetical protein IW262DRAFT_1486002 [Armillaria fumosa]|nr:hypothetical protein IW262DRAFT_1486002 [Armillaria fumosa]